jgi:hypothetical protein
MTMLVLSLWLGLSGPLNQSPSGLAGVWLREAGSRTALDDAAPAWEEITIDVTQVTIRRASRPRVTEVYPVDGVERSTVRVRQNRVCRTAWDGATLILDCREVDGGPGGLALPVMTRETRSVDANDRMVVEIHWNSGDQVVTRRERYRRQEQ